MLRKKIKLAVERDASRYDKGIIAAATDARDEERVRDKIAANGFRAVSLLDTL